MSSSPTPESSKNNSNKAGGGNDGSSPGGSGGPNEDQLRKQLQKALQSLNRREPLDPTYKRLVLNGIVTSRRPVLPKDKFYKRVGSRLRDRVEAFMTLTEGKDPFDRISQRQPLEEKEMRAALTLREWKEHEQQPLLEATLASVPKRNGMDELERKKHFEGIAMTLQAEKKKTTYPSPMHHTASGRSKSPNTTNITAAQQTEKARMQADLERQKSQARARELARQRRVEEDRKKREEEMIANSRKRKHLSQNQGGAETPQQALHKVYHPIFKKLWDMEFANLNGTNPFRIVIDRANCASMGAPDYFDVITIPMNLTYIQQKVEKMEYNTLQDFFKDIDLMISNAVLYNSDPSNPYRIAAEEMKRRYMKMAKKILQSLKEKQQSQNK